ncbi:hypothetical protein MRB53_036602 [Persea americana]|nr:hypothetical protein MRB53_036780 [Persea americana]KAJ8614014.1 hypothetical protein MRB53_036740 [Persea americana]KAJ8614404.1 hypothetical protein MRB53_036602 [Persea americana]
MDRFPLRLCGIRAIRDQSEVCLSVGDSLKGTLKDVCSVSVRLTSWPWRMRRVGLLRKIGFGARLLRGCILSLDMRGGGGATLTRGEDKDMSKYLSAVLPWIRGSRRDSGLAFVLEVGTAAVMLAFEGLVRRMT